MLRNLFLFTLILFSPIKVSADPYIPEQLKPWVSWVLDDNSNRDCAVSDKTKECVWPTSLNLIVRSDSADFSLEATLEVKTLLPLPGNEKNWPQDISLESTNQQAVLLQNIDGLPFIQLEKGNYRVKGKFYWQEMPKELRVPPNIGLVKLEVNGRTIKNPTVASSGKVWLEGVENLNQVQADTLDISVARKLREDLPFEINTWLNLKVSGKSRELKLSNFLPAKSEVVNIKSDLAYNFEPSENTLSIQLKPGNYNLYIESLSKQPPESLSAIVVDNKFWPESEIWAYEQNENLRVVDIDGVTLINTSQVEMPDEWKSLPSYLIKKDSKMKLLERARGQIDVPINNLSLVKNVWLDLNGNGFTIEDQFSGNIYKDWRLNILSPYSLTRAEVNEEDLLITTDPKNNLSGVEIRDNNLNLKAYSRLDKFITSLPLVGWDSGVSSLNFNLILGPGWSLLHASGLNAPTSWVSSWSLWHVFTICLISIVAAKTYSQKWGVFVFLLLVICHSQAMSPQYFILNLLIAKALVTYLRQDSLKKYTTAYYLYSLALFIIVSFIFIVRQVRIGLFPQLERFSYGTVLEFNFLYVFIFSLGFLITLYLFIKAIICFFSHRKLKAIFLFFLSGIVTIFISGILSSISYYPAAYDSPVSRSRSVRAPVATKIFNDSALMNRAEQEVYSDMNFEGAGKVEEPSYQQKTKLLRQVDPNSKLQTGVALPNWNWNSNNLYSSGPVDKSKTVSLYLLSPMMNLLLCVFRILFLLLIMKSINFKELLSKSFVNLGFVIVLLLVSFNFVKEVRADDFPSTNMLNELRLRLDRDKCFRNCVSTQRLDIEIKNNQLTINAKVYSLDNAAWLSPGPITQFNPQSITVDGSKTTALRRDERNLLQIKINKGYHEISIVGDLSATDLLNLNLYNNPGYVAVNASEWTVDGLSPTGSVNNSLQFLRKETRAKEKNKYESNKASELSQWYVVDRKLYIDLPWEVETQVRRIGSIESAKIVKVPLLEGEEIISESYKVEDGFVEVNIPRGVTQVSWKSRFKVSSKIELKAEVENNLTEVWELNCSAIFQCDYQGANPVSKSSPLVIWNPWPGEQVTIDVRKPEGVIGVYQTIDNATLSWTPGEGIAKANLNLTLRSSQKGYQTLKISPDAQIEQLLVNNVTRNVVVEKGEIQLPLEIGEQQIQINWQQPWEFKFIQKYPTVDLGGEVNNLRITTSISESRWLLYACGPKWGPVILFWGNVFAVIILAIIFSKCNLQPLSTLEWTVLGLGLIFVHPLTILIFAFYFLILDKKSLLAEKSNVIYNFVQILLIFMTVVNLIVLFFSIYNGLVLKPSMSITGDGSYEYALSWFVDKFSNQLPDITVISLPIWTWRAIMLVWSTWLVFALIRWAKWSWESFEKNGIWQREAKAVQGEILEP